MSPYFDLWDGPQLVQSMVRVSKRDRRIYLERGYRIEPHLIPTKLPERGCTQMSKTKEAPPAMPVPVTPGAFEVTLVAAKETPGTIQYKEVDEPLKPQVVGTQYIKKHAALALGPTIKILITTA